MNTRQIKNWEEQAAWAYERDCSEIAKKVWQERTAVKRRKIRTRVAELLLTGCGRKYLADFRSDYDEEVNECKRDGLPIPRVPPELVALAELQRRRKAKSA